MKLCTKYEFMNMSIPGFTKKLSHFKITIVLMSSYGSHCFRDYLETFTLAGGKSNMNFGLLGSTQLRSISTPGPIVEER